MPFKIGQSVKCTCQAWDPPLAAGHDPPLPDHIYTIKDIKMVTMPIVGVEYEFLQFVELNKHKDSFLAKWFVPMRRHIDFTDMMNPQSSWVPDESNSEQASADPVGA